MVIGTLSRYFGKRFFSSVVGSFLGVVVLAAMIDYVELMRRGADWPNATPWLLAKISMFRVPALTERIMPFSVLVGTMSCYLNLSRRLELVIARAAGVSAWQLLSRNVVKSCRPTSGCAASCIAAASSFGMTRHARPRSSARSGLRFTMR